MPLPSCCHYPSVFGHNSCGPLGERELYLEVFLSRKSPCADSALESVQVREALMGAAIDRENFDYSLLGPEVWVLLLLDHLCGKVEKIKAARAPRFPSPAEDVPPSPSKSRLAKLLRSCLPAKPRKWLLCGIGSRKEKTGRASETEPLITAANRTPNQGERGHR